MNEKHTLLALGGAAVVAGGVLSTSRHFLPPVAQALLVGSVAAGAALTYTFLRRTHTLNQLLSGTMTELIEAGKRITHLTHDVAGLETELAAEKDRRRQSQERLNATRTEYAAYRETHEKATQALLLAGVPGADLRDLGLDYIPAAKLSALRNAANPAADMMLDEWRTALGMDKDGFAVRRRYVTVAELERFVKQYPELAQLTGAPPEDRTMTRIALLACLLTLSGCVTATHHVAPRPVVYSKEFQAAAADELERINAPHVSQMITDYGRERAKLRALEK